MAHPSSLVAGNCYFLVHYYDRDLLVPNVSTLVFRESRVDEETGHRLWLFDEPTSSAEVSDAGGSIAVGLPDSQLHQILEIDELIGTFKELAGFHPFKHSAVTRKQPGIAKAVLAELSANIGAFFDDTDFCSLTVTIRYTDNGLSLARRERSSFKISFYPRPKRNPDLEGRITGFFDERGIKAHDDYLADKGRTRILGYPVDSDQGEVTDMCLHIFRDVYGILEDDLMEYTFLRSKDVAS